MVNANARHALLARLPAKWNFRFADRTLKADQSAFLCRETGSRFRDDALSCGDES